MAYSPIPFKVANQGEVEEAPEGAIPVAIYGAEPEDPILQALVDVGFGDPGQVLAMNNTGNGFEWIDL